jgi:hypothetical protein
MMMRSKSAEDERSRRKVTPSVESLEGRALLSILPILLPSTGLAPSQYRFNYWPEDGGPPVSSSVASLAPESTDTQVDTVR